MAEIWFWLKDDAEIRLISYNFWLKLITIDLFLIKNAKIGSILDLFLNILISNKGLKMVEIHGKWQNPSKTWLSMMAQFQAAFFGHSGQTKKTMDLDCEHT